MPWVYEHHKYGNTIHEFGYLRHKDMCTSKYVYSNSNAISCTYEEDSEKVHLWTIKYYHPSLFWSTNIKTLLRCPDWLHASTPWGHLLNRLQPLWQLLKTFQWNRASKHWIRSEHKGIYYLHGSTSSTHRALTNCQVRRTFTISLYYLSQLRHL